MTALLKLKLYAERPRRRPRPAAERPERSCDENCRTWNRAAGEAIEDSRKTLAAGDAIDTLTEALRADAARLGGETLTKTERRNVARNVVVLCAEIQRRAALLLDD
jgi:hypothetical protein